MASIVPIWGRKLRLHNMRFSYTSFALCRLRPISFQLIRQKASTLLNVSCVITTYSNFGWRFKYHNIYIPTSIFIHQICRSVYYLKFFIKMKIVNLLHLLFIRTVTICIYVWHIYVYNVYTLCIRVYHSDIRFFFWNGHCIFLNPYVFY